MKKIFILIIYFVILNNLFSSILPQPRSVYYNTTDLHDIKIDKTGKMFLLLTVMNEDYINYIKKLHEFNKFVVIEDYKKNNNEYYCLRIWAFLNNVSDKNFIKLNPLPIIFFNTQGEKLVFKYKIISKKYFNNEGDFDLIVYVPKSYYSDLKEGKLLFNIVIDNDFEKAINVNDSYVVKYDDRFDGIVD